MFAGMREGVLDHLGLAAESLARVLRSRARAGRAARGRWQHARMGTHNRLLRVGEVAYLELIAVDPGGRAARPTALVRARRSAMTRTRVGGRTAAVHWVARVETTGSRRSRSTSAPGSPSSAATSPGSSRSGATARCRRTASSRASSAGVVPPIPRRDSPTPESRSRRWSWSIRARPTSSASSSCSGSRTGVRRPGPADHRAPPDPGGSADASQQRSGR